MSTSACGVSHQGDQSAPVGPPKPTSSASPTSTGLTTQQLALRQDFATQTNIYMDGLRELANVLPSPSKPTMNQAELTKGVTLAAKMDVALRAAQADAALDNTCARATFTRIIGDMNQAQDGVKAAITAVKQGNTQELNDAIANIHAGATDIPTATEALSSISTQTC